MKKRFLGLLFASSVAFIAPTQASYLESNDAQALIKELAAEGLDAAHVRSILGEAKYQQRIIDAISKPAERTLTWGDYRKIFIQPDRVAQGVEFWQQNQAELSAAEEKYGVPASIITAIIGVETRYGRHAGNWKAIDALATLGFDYPPRAAFFRKELKELFLLEKEAGIDIREVKGSYAGALGTPQFIPSSYRAYAVDGDGDGKIDLINNNADVIHSVANYFAKHRWQKDLPVAAKALLNNNADTSIFSTEYAPSITLSDAVKAGAPPISCATKREKFCYDLPASTKIAPLVLDGAEGDEYWLVTHNFYVITRYNHSRLYAMAVFQLSRAIAEEMEK